MPNDYFQFQQFRIEQRKCGMKVCTDSCVLGAYARHSDPKYILDIGAGTGLLALMLAQRYISQIDAVELDPNSFSQARTNFWQSPWPDRIQIFKTRIQDFSSTHKYDLIISNPPFFRDHILPKKEGKGMATNQDDLSFEDLVKVVNHNLGPDGLFWIILPPVQSELFNLLAPQNQLYRSHQLFISDQVDSPVIRVISSFKKQRETSSQESQYLKIPTGEYSGWFSQLMKDYYLNSLTC